MIFVLFYETFQSKVSKYETGLTANVLEQDPNTVSK